MLPRNPDRSKKPNVDEWFRANPNSEAHWLLALRTMIDHFDGDHGFIDKRKVVEYRFGSSYASYGSAQAFVTRRYTRVRFWLTEKRQQLAATDGGERKTLKSATGQNLYAIDFKVAELPSAVQLDRFLCNNALPGWRTAKRRARDPDPLHETNATMFVEGAVVEVLVNRYERDESARERCIALHGANCAVCTMSFAQRYGADAIGFIHVHHVVPLSSLKRSYRVDPKTDLIPVCPNCHSMLHRFNCGPQELAERMQAAAASTKL